MTNPLFPATSLTAATALTIEDANLLHEVINGTDTETIEVDDGPIPSLRKALVDNFYFKNPIDWTETAAVTEFNQLVLFTDGTLWVAPTARTTNPILMGATPYGDSLWEISPYSKLYTVATSLNVSITEVVYATDTATVLDDVLYIYDLDNEVTWGKPSSVGAGEVIVSVVGDQLTTDVTTYTLKNLTATNFIRTVDDMKTYSSLRIGDVITTKGYTTVGDSGDNTYEIVAASTGVDDGGSYIDLSASGLQAKGLFLKGQVYLQQFGAISDYNISAGTGTDNQVALAAAEIFCYNNELDLIFAGRFGVGSDTTHKAIKHFGVMYGTSGLYALNDGHRIYTWTGGDTTGEAMFKDLTLHGYADRNTTQGGDESAIIEISPIDEVIFDNVEFAYSRQMSCKSRAKRSIARNCHVHHSLRDGINFTDSEYRLVDGCEIKYCADDAIACHSNSGNAFVESIIVNNTIYNSFGIKCLSHKATIANNRGEFIFGYGLYYGVDGTEGDISSIAMDINNNTFLNIINATKVGGGNVGAGLLSIPAYDTNTNGFYPNEYDTTADQFVDPLLGLEEFSTTQGSVGTLSININNNNFLQTWTGGTTVSDYGRGDEAWTINGFSDIALTGTLGKDANVVYAYRFDTVVENVSCSFGVTYGFRTGLLFQNAKAINNVYFKLGQMSRIYDKIIEVVKDGSVSTLHCMNAQIVGGSVDMDPMHEHPDRELSSGEPTGAWTNTGSANALGIYCPSITGLIWEYTSIRNMQKIALVSGGGVIIPIIRRLKLFAGDDIGIGSMTFYRDHDRVFIDADPRSANYGDILQGNLFQSSSLPTSGYYFQGQTINNNNYSATIGGNTFSKIFRLTTGNGHVLNTDWGIIPLVKS